MMEEMCSYCYACGKRIKRTISDMPTAVLCDDDGRRVAVGPECIKKIIASGAHGYKPTKGGPRLFWNELLRAEWLART